VHHPQLELHKTEESQLQLASSSTWP
jgi:hypothetical protein